MTQTARYLGYLIAAGLAMACLVALRGDLAQLSLATLVRSWDLLLFAAVLSLGNYLLRITRWMHYLARLGHRLPPYFVGLTYSAGFAFTVTPGKVGEMVRARYYQRNGVPLRDVAGAFFMERLMDLLAMMMLGSLILSAFPRYSGAIWGTLAVTLLILAGMRFVPWASIAQKSSVINGAPRSVARVLSGLEGTLSAARALLRPDIMLKGFLISLVAWGLEGFGLYVLSGMIPTGHPGILTGIGIYAVAVTVGAISFLPGGLGSTEAVMTGLLAAQGYSVAEALLITLACRLVTLWLAVLIGWVAVWALRHRVQGQLAPW